MNIIVGAGPAGLTLAYLLGRKGQRCVVIDREQEVGGCHRVIRVNGHFTEHSPRVYLSSYLNMFWLLREMGVTVTFKKYDYGIPYLLRSILSRLRVQEVAYLGLSFFMFLLNPNMGKEISVEDWFCSFSERSRELLDRLCRFTDGAGSDRYSIYKLFQLVNQNLFYKVLQPSHPNDIGLFSQMRAVIEATGNVTFLLGRKVDRVLISSGRVTGVSFTTETGPEVIEGGRVLLCVPPKNLHAILSTSSIAFPMSLSTYDTYLSATFHYSRKVDFRSKWGFPESEWGLISIPIGNYLSDVSIFSVTCMYLNKKSSVLGLAVDEIQDQSVLLGEMFRQLKETYPELPQPDLMLLSPTAYYNQGWKERDSAFIKTVGSDYLDSKVGGVEGLYQIGTQNGRSQFSYTTFESAVTNAMQWYNSVVENKIVIQNPVPLTRVLWIVIILFLAYRVYRALKARLS